MHDWILFLTLTVTALSLSAAGIVCRCCRKTEREKDRRIVQAVREHDRLVRQLEQTRIEAKTLERMLDTELSESAETDAPDKTNDNS